MGTSTKTRPARSFRAVRTPRDCTANGGDRDDRTGRSDGKSTGGTADTDNTGDTRNSGGNDGGNDGGASGWFRDMGGAFLGEVKQAGTSLVNTPVQAFTSGWECVFANERCGESLMYGIAASPSGQSMAMAQESITIYGDYRDGRSAEATGKIVFNLAALATTRGEGAGLASAGKEASLWGRLTSAVKEVGAKCSFSAETPVLMDGGKTKPIGKIKIGDKVEAANQKTGKHVGARAVTATLINHDKDLVDLTVRAADGQKSVLHTTSKHPFWDDTTKAWVPAASLTPGHALNTAQDQHAFVAGIRTVPGEADMYNLTVADLHTYFVLAGTTPVLVHNACPTGITFVADASGTVVPTSAARLEAGLRAAVDVEGSGFSSYPTRSAGVGYQLPDGSKIRIMQPTANGARLRASFTAPTGR